MFNEEEVFFICPYCMQNVSILVETLNGNQSYIEDCEVCCQPIQFSYIVQNGQLQEITATKAD